MRLDKPIGISLLLWPTLWALWFASAGLPESQFVAVFVLGTVLMRSAGCVANDMADRRFDPFVARTKARPLASGEVSLREALLLFIVLVLAAFCLILPFLTDLVFALISVALFLAVSYPFTKRFLAIPQAYLGVAFGFGIPIVYAVIQGSVPLEAWWMLLANVFWAIAYDTEYAMVDREDDRKLGLKTSAITFGTYDVLIVMLCYALMLCLLGALGAYKNAGSGFYIGIVLAAAIAGFHYSLIRDKTPEGCFKAFRHNHWLGAALFAGILCDSIFPFTLGWP